MAPTSSTLPSSNKLLMTDLNPKSRPKPCPTAPPNSASSSSTTTVPPPPEKKTRDQPNLSDCHCCGGRINSTNPKDRLQPLDSVWRVVLLCRDCRRNIRSGQTCPYCFRGTENSGDFLTCSVCERKIHRDCVRNYGNCTPWCYLGVGSEGFRVCVDCWVPELLKNSIRVSGRSENKGGSKDNVVKSKARLDMDSPNAENLNCGDSVEAADDTELAIQLHRAMNSSPRITMTKSLVKTQSDLDISNIRDWNGLSYTRSRLGKNHGVDKKFGTCTNIDSTGLNLGLQCYKRDKTRKIWQLIEGVATKTRCSVHSGCVHVDKNGHEILIYRRSRFKRKLFQVDGPVGGSEESSSLDNRSAACEPECCQVDDAEAILDRYHLKYEKRNAGTKPESSFLRFISLPSQNNSKVAFDKDGPRYHLKYAKRDTGTKRESSFVRYTALLSENRASEPVLNNSAVGCSVESDGKLIFQIGTVNPDLDRYCYKYTKRLKSSKSGSISVLKGIDASAAGLPTNCSTESRTMSDVTFDSFTVDPSK
ncbi:hypothetical protein PHJA_000852900 [Phtheirospermum japonicum]|uniref:Uncharacterized protein n=1 Tax=Phtheirospermum japonicum TaxID=374723 RepID=A0A830BYH8_9LAMI|nr:hypothetical protein PHJA_000852900 [Phtheirospermum japonicum]